MQSYRKTLSRFRSRACGHIAPPALFSILRLPHERAPPKVKPSSVVEGRGCRNFHVAYSYPRLRFDPGLATGAGKVSHLGTAVQGLNTASTLD